MKKVRLLLAMAGLMLVGWSIQGYAQEKKLVVWSHWKGDPIKREFMRVVTEAFQKQHGITVEVVWMEKNELLEKLPLSLGPTVPDISYIDGGFTHPRIVSGLADLSDLKFAAPTTPSWTLGSVGDGKNNYLPLEGASSAMYYNKDVFQQANISLPQDRSVTAQEFLGIIRALRAAGITPIGEGGSDREWKIGIPLLYTIFRYMGLEKTNQLMKGELTFSDPDAVAALTFWKQVVDAQGYDSAKAVALNLNDGIYEVTDGRAGINFCGTWIYSKFGMTDRDKGQVGVLDWFTVENGKGNEMYELTWVAGYGINKNSQYLQDAKKFLEFLVTPEAAAAWVQYVQGPYPVTAQNIPANSLYGALEKLRTNKQAVNLSFNFLPFPAKAANNMWVEETKKFVTGQHSVEELITNMNSRLK